MTWTLRDKAMKVRPGTSLSIPRDTPHFYANQKHTTARILCLQTPGVLGPEYYLEMADCFQSGYPDLAGMGAIMSRYGIVPISNQKEQHIFASPQSYEQR